MDDASWQKLKASSPVRIQWDPERNLKLAPQIDRSIQVGLSGIAVDQYITQWIQNITDITALSVEIGNLVDTDQLDLAMEKLPIESPYPLPEGLREKLGMDISTHISL